MDPTGPTGPLEEEEHACFQDLPFELQLSVAHFLDNDRAHGVASLCVAVPRFGVKAIRSRDDWQAEPLFAIAMRLASAPGSIIDERMLRKYANDLEADAADFEWLRRVNAEAGSSLRLEAEEQRFTSDGQIHAVRWTLCNDEGDRAPVRVERLVLGERFVLGALGAIPSHTLKAAWCGTVAQDESPVCVAGGGRVLLSQHSAETANRNWRWHGDSL